jgi:hypothetical protein
MTFRKATQHDYNALADMRWIHLEDDGEDLSAYNKQTFVFEFRDYHPTTELTSGKVGFRTTSQNVSFDNVLVTQ